MRKTMTLSLVLCISFLATLGACKKKEDSKTASRALKRVFVTSTIHSGNLGGLTGADSICAQQASSAGRSGTWVAWLSDNNTDAIDRITIDAAWFILDGNNTVIFGSKENLKTQPTNGTLKFDENGQDISGNSNVRVWTGTAEGGKHRSSCQNWSSGFAGDSGASGQFNNGDATWTDKQDAACNDQQHLYCFEL